MICYSYLDTLYLFPTFTVKLFFGKETAKMKPDGLWKKMNNTYKDLKKKKEKGPKLML